MHENRNGVKLYDYVTRLVEVFGENAAIAFSYLLSTLFRDIIFRRTRHFPILNLFGEKGTGKTTLATSLQSFFLHGVDPPNLGVTSVPAMNDRVSQAVNTLVVLDEYKNDLDIRKIAYLKGLWGGGGQTKRTQVRTEWRPRPSSLPAWHFADRTSPRRTWHLHPCHLPCFLQDIVQPGGEKKL